YAGQIEGRGRTEDDLAYLRDERQFTNTLLVEQPNGVYAHTIVRSFLFDAYHLRSEEHTSELQSRENLVCRLLLEKKKKHKTRRDLPQHRLGAAGEALALAQLDRHRRRAAEADPRLVGREAGVGVAQLRARLSDEV